MELTVEIPESPQIRGPEVVEGAASRLGWTEDMEDEDGSPVTPQAFLESALAEYVWTHYKSHRHQRVDEEVRESLPRPVKPGRRPEDIPADTP